MAKPPPGLALALVLLAMPFVGGCADPEGGALVGATAIEFVHRPVGTAQGVEIVWDVRIINPNNETSAPAKFHLEVRSSGTGFTSEAEAPVAPIAARQTAAFTVRTRYDGIGDYTGLAQILVGSRVVATAAVFFEKCTPFAAC